MKKTILFFDVCNPAYIPLIKAVCDRGYHVVMNGCGLRDHLQDDGVHLSPFERFFAADSQSHVHKATQEIVTNLVSALNLPGMNKAFSSSVGNFLGHTGKAFFENLCSLIGPEIWVIEALESLISQYEVSLVVLGCDNSPMQRALVKAAAKYKVPTLHVVHGIPGRTGHIPAGEIGHLYADFMAAYGEIHRSRMIENGVSQDRIFLTGSPLWDPLYKPEVSMSKEEACHSLKLNPRYPVIVYCTSYADGAKYFFLARSRELLDLHHTVLQAVSRMGPDVQLLVRPHPVEVGRAQYPEAELHQLEEAFKAWVMTHHDVDIRLIRDRKIESIRAADLVITTPSNIISEAMILQRPVMAISLRSEENGIISEEYQRAQVVYDKTQIYPMVKELLEKPSMREKIVQRQNALLPDINFGHDGQATGRVADLIEQLSTPPSTDVVQCPAQVTLSNRLRIVLAAHNFPPHSYAGTELYTYDVAKALQNRGHEVTVFHPIGTATTQTPQDVLLTRYENLPVALIELTPSQYGVVRNDTIKPAIRNYFLEHPVDIVHIQHLMGLSVSFIEILVELNIPIVLTANDFWFLCEQIHLVEPTGMVCAGPETIDKCVGCFNSRYGPISEDRMPDLFRHLADRLYTCRSALTNVDLVLCPSEFLLKMFRAYGFEAKKMIHSPQGASVFKPLDSSRQSSDSLVFAYLGNIAYRKGLDILIDAINRVDTTNAEFRIYGAVSGPEYFGQAMMKVKKEKKVIFYGPYSPQELPGILSQIHVAIVPSRGENYPFIIREVLHGGVPVIASSVAGIPEIVQHRKNGLLFQAGSAQDLSEKIKEVIQFPHMIDQFRGNIQPIKSIEQEVDEFESYYASVIASRDPSSRNAVIGAEPSLQIKNDPSQKDLEVPEARPLDRAGQGSMFDVSIIIPVFNRIDLTKQCLTELASVTDGVRYEVIVVDNASTDGTHEFLGSLEGDIQIITNKKNLGFAKACNQGAHASRGKNLVFLNNDTVPLVGWLKTLVHEIEADSSVDVVGSKLLYGDSSIQHAGVVFSRLYQTPYHIFQGLPHDFPPVNVRREFQAVTAACMLVRKETFEKVSGFDEGFVNGFEDVDLCLKIRQLGKKVIYQPKSCLYHLESQTEGRKTHDVANAKRLLARWGHLWFIDEDIVAAESGYCIQQYVSNEKLRSRLVPKHKVENLVAWQTVTNLQQLLLGKKCQPLEDMTERQKIEELVNDIHRWPSDLGILEWVGRVCETLQCEAEAKRFWEKSLSIRDLPHARLGLTRASLKKGNLQEAQKHLDILKNEFSPREDGWTLQGVLYMQTQEFLLAKDAFEMALKCDQSYERALIGLGMARMGLGEHEEAWTQFNQVLLQDPDNIEAIRCLIQVGTALKKWKRLFRQLDHFVERNLAASEIRFALAGVAVRAGHIEKAREQLSWFQLFEPDYEGLEDLSNALNNVQVQEPTMSA